MTVNSIAWGFVRRHRLPIAAASSFAVFGATVAAGQEPGAGSPLLSTSSILALIITSIFSGGMGLRLLDHYTGRGERKKSELTQALESWKAYSTRLEEENARKEVRIAEESQKKHDALNKVMGLTEELIEAREKIEHLTMDVKRYEGIVDSQMRTLAAARLVPPSGSAP